MVGVYILALLKLVEKSGAMNFFLPWFSNLKIINVPTSYDYYLVKMNCFVLNPQDVAQYTLIVCLLLLGLNYYESFLISSKLPLVKKNQG